MGSPNVGLNLRVDAEAARRLKLHSAVGGGTISAIVSKLVLENLMNLVVVDGEPSPEEAASSLPASRRVADCVRWLADTLDAKPRYVMDVVEMAEKEGFSRATLYRARDEMPVVTVKLGPNQRSAWQIDPLG